MERDLYAVVGVGSEATPEDLRRHYRRKVLELRTERNGGSLEAADAFQALAAAYAVLGDPERRAAYDARGPAGVESSPGDAFADLFAHPAFGPLFDQLAREFQAQGLRFGEACLHRVFRGRRGGFFFGGGLIAGPLGDSFTHRPAPGGQPATARSDPASPPRRPGLPPRLLRSAAPAPPAPRGEHPCRSS